MSDPHAAGSGSLGLSVGATNLAATLDGRTTLLRPSELKLRGQRITGFVERVADPVPLITPDGSAHHCEHLLAQALSELAHATTDGAQAATAALAVPAHWPPAVVDTLRRTMPNLSPVVSDAHAALTALRDDPGLPGRGVVVLCDFGGSGTTISLADATADFTPIGEPVRIPDFSGDQIDQALLTHVLAGLVDPADAAGTAMVGSLARLRNECRAAKKRLSDESATAVFTDLPGERADIRITRAELDDLIRGPLADLLAAMDATLHRFRVPVAAVSAVATIGGGARIPLITQQLSEHLRVPVITQARPHLTAARGAGLIARHSRVLDTATAMAPAGAAAVPTSVIGTSAPATGFAALAWSDDDSIDDTLYGVSRPDVHFRHDEPDEPEPPARRSPIVLFGLSAAAAVITTVVFALMQFGSDTPVEAATTVAPPPAPAAPVLSPAPPAPQAPDVTTVVKPAQRTKAAPPQPRHTPPGTRHPVAAPTTTPSAPATTAAPTTTAPTTTPTPTTTTPTVPPIDPGPGDGGTGTSTPSVTPPIDPGNGAGGTEIDTPPADAGNGSEVPTA